MRLATEHVAEPRVVAVEALAVAAARRSSSVAAAELIARGRLIEEYNCLQSSLSCCYVVRVLSRQRPLIPDGFNGTMTNMRFDSIVRMCECAAAARDARAGPPHAVPDLKYAVPLTLARLYYVVDVPW